MSDEPVSVDKLARTAKTVALAAVPLLLLVLLVVSIVQREYAEPLFVHTTYFLLLVTVVTWAATYLHVACALKRADVIAWIKDNLAGIALALVVTVVAGLAIDPALRVLSDEAGLVGTSRNFFLNKTATFTTTGKYYYDQFWENGLVIDRRPCLFPFLVSLLHVLRGYSYTNAFLLNLIVLPVFVLVAYRIGKLLAGESFGLVAGVFVVTQPITLISARSGGFDCLAALFALLVAHGFLAHARNPSPARLAILWMNLCMFAEVRYETALFLPLVVILLLGFRLAPWEHLKPFAPVYALTPAYLLPRIWQSMLLGDVPEQEPGAVTFSLQNFVNNAREYFKPIFSPFDFHLPHSALILALGVVGTVLAVRWGWARMRARAWQAPELRFGVMVVAWMALQTAIIFSYVWGRAQHPGSARLVITIDTWFAFLGAWTLVAMLKRLRPYFSILVAAAIFATYLPVAAQHRIQNELTLTREAATAWRFFASLHEKRILIVADRPSLYTIMEYGALDYDTARQDALLLPALSRRLFYDVYLVQKISLTTHQPVPQHEIWPDRPRQTVLEFQNDANAMIRISRLER